jgi:glycosyltransferase involved in cell wall biosynthesis
MIHGSSAWSYTAMGRVRGFGQLLGEQLAIGRADAVALVAGSTLPYYRDRYPEHADRFVWIPNGVDVARFERADGKNWRCANGFDDLDRIILYHGRYDREKGIGRMLAAFRVLADRDQRWHLVCAGAGPDGKELNSAAATWARGRIHDLGFVSPSALPSVLAAADIGLLLSDFEGLSNSVLEALASGIPVVATDVGDNRLILERVASGLIVDPDPATVAGAIECAWERREAIRAQAKRIANEFSLDARLRRLIELFWCVAERRRPLVQQNVV